MHAHAWHARALTDKSQKYVLASRLLDVASNSPTVRPVIANVPTECANVSIASPCIHGVWCFVVIELEYHLDADVAVDCPSCGALTVTMPTECANVSIVQHQVSFVSMVFGVLVVIELEYHLDALVEH